MSKPKYINPGLVGQNLLGIDIGKSGGIVYNRGSRLIIAKYESPLCLIDGFCKCDKAVAEDVHTMPGQGIVSNGSLMESKGIVRGIALALGKHVRFIQPIEWIKCYTMKRTKHFDSHHEWKKHLVECAKEVSPENEELLNLKTADAFLMWNWMAAQEIGEPFPEYGQMTFTFQSQALIPF